MNLTVSQSFATTSRIYLILVFLVTISTRYSIAEKLSADLQAPLFAKGAGGLRLEPPLEGPVKTYPAISKQTNNPNIGNGEYSFRYETEDGVQREEVGKLKKVGKSLVTVVEGRYSYTSPEGLAIDVKYSADENGARSSFRFGTNPGKWKPSLFLTGSLGSPGDKGKLTSSITSGYLPPITAEKITNDYLPPGSSSTT